MANQTIKQLTALTEQTIDKTNDLIAVWDEDTVTPANSITKKVSAGNIVTSPNSGVDVGGGNTNGRVNRIVSISQAEYDLVDPKDGETLYVITDGTTSIADSDDVTITGATDNDFLVYETNAWVNKTQSNTRTALGLGPYATAATITDSYVGHIETPADGTYYLDPKVAEAREITGVYFAWTAGGSPDGDIDVQIGGTSVLSATGRMNSGTTFTGTIKTDGTEDVAADAVITVVLGGTNGVADITDLRFAVEYTQ